MAFCLKNRDGWSKSAEMLVPVTSNMLPAPDDHPSHDLMQLPCTNHVLHSVWQLYCMNSTPNEDESVDDVITI